MKNRIRPNRLPLLAALSAAGMLSACAVVPEPVFRSTDADNVWENGAEFHTTLTDSLDFAVALNGLAAEYVSQYQYARPLAFQVLVSNRSRKTVLVGP